MESFSHLSQILVIIHKQYKTKIYFQKLCKFLDAERKSHTIYPPPDKVFTWTQMTPINKVWLLIFFQTSNQLISYT